MPEPRGSTCRLLLREIGMPESSPGKTTLCRAAGSSPLRLLGSCDDLSDAGDYGELVPPSIEPGLVDRLIAAVLAGDVQPLIDERLERDVTLQPVRLLGEIERLVGMNGAQDTGMQLLLIARLRGVG